MITTFQVIIIIAVAEFDRAILALKHPDSTRTTTGYLIPTCNRCVSTVYKYNWFYSTYLPGM